MKILDLKTLEEATEKVIALTAGEVTVRRLSQIEYLSLLPAAPAQADTWKPADAATCTPEQLRDYAVAKEQEWLESLSPADRVMRRSELLEVMYMAISRAVLKPRMTAEQAKRLGDDAFIIFQAIRDLWRDEGKATENGDLTPAASG